MDNNILGMNSMDNSSMGNMGKALLNFIQFII